MNLAGICCSLPSWSEISTDKKHRASETLFCCWNLLHCAVFLQVAVSWALRATVTNGRISLTRHIHVTVLIQRRNSYQFLMSIKRERWFVYKACRWWWWKETTDFPLKTNHSIEREHVGIMKRYILCVFGSVSSVAGNHITPITCSKQAVADDMLHCLLHIKQKINIIFTISPLQATFKLLQPRVVDSCISKVVTLQLWIVLNIIRSFC